MAQNLADKVAKLIADLPKTTEVTECGDGIYGVTHDGVGYSIVIQKTQ